MHLYNVKAKRISNLQLRHANPGRKRQRKLTIHHGHAGEQIIGNQQIAIQIRKVHRRRELRGGGDATGSLRHAAEHDAHVEGAGEIDHLVGFAEAGAFHQLDVDAGEEALHGGDVDQALDGFIGKKREGAAFVEPGLVIDTAHGHGLLDHHDAVFLEPVDHVEGLEAVGPALVGIDGERKVGDGADGLDHLLVGVESDLDFQDVEPIGALERFLADDLGGVDADGKCCRWRLAGVVAPDFVPGRAEHFADEVVQGDVDGSLRGAVARGETVDVREDILEAERVLELLEIHPLEEGGDGVHALAEVGRHRRFAVAGVAFEVDFHLHAWGRVPAVGGDGEGVLELELVGVELQLKVMRADLLGRLFRGRLVDRDRGAPAAAAADHQPGAHGGQSGHLQKLTSVLCHYSL